MRAGGIGRPPTLPSSVEDNLVTATKRAADMGFGLSRKQLLTKTGKIVKQLKLKTSFKNGVPGKDWFLNLRKRYPGIAIKKPQKLSVTRAKSMNREVISEYFNLLKSKLDELKVQPNQIWNCDETNMQLEHTPKAVVGRKGANLPGRVSNSKESVSVLGCGNAAGDIMSPMVIVKGKTQRSLMGWKTEEAPLNTKWAFQSKSYMDQGLGVEWFKNVFLKECGPERPQLLIVDSHCSHEPLELLEMARKENITLLSLPSHCTHHLQPWDKSMFAPLKNKYNQLCSDFMSEHRSHNITKQTWPGLFARAWESSVTAVHMVSGFVSTGICPFNPKAIPDKAFLPNSVDTVQHETSGNMTQAPETNATRNNCEIIYSQQQDQAQVIEVAAEIHAPPLSPVLNETEFVLEFPIQNEDGDQQTLNLPVFFGEDSQSSVTSDGLDLENISLVEAQDTDLPSELWTSDLESMFLPAGATEVPPVKKKSSATSSRILTSSEVIQAKKEKEEMKEQKAKEAIEKKKRAEERKKIAEKKRQTKLARMKAKKKSKASN